MDIRNGTTQTLADGPDAKSSPRWLCSGDITYANGSGIEHVKAASGPRGEFGNPSWTEDGTRMVFHRETDSAWPPFQAKTTLDRGFQLIRTGIFPSYSSSGDRLVC